MKKCELSAFVNFDNCFESQFPVGGEVGALNRVFVLIKYEDKLEDFYKEEALASYPDVRAIDSFTYTFKDSNVVDLSKSEESREKAPEGPSDALEDFGAKEDLETLLEVMRGLRDDVNGELNDSCVAGVRLVSVRAVDAPGAANYFRRARKDIDERTGLVRLSEIETNELFDKEIGVVVPYLSLRAYIKTGEKGLFARQMEKAQREVMKGFEK